MAAMSLPTTEPASLSGLASVLASTLAGSWKTPPWMTLRWLPPKLQQLWPRPGTDVDRCMGESTAPAAATSAVSSLNVDGMLSDFGIGAGDDDVGFSKHDVAAGISEAETFLDLISLWRSTCLDQALAPAFWEFVVQQLYGAGKLGEFGMNAITVSGPGDHSARFFSAIGGRLSDSEGVSVSAFIRDRLVQLIDRDLVIVNPLLIETIELFVDRALPRSLKGPQVAVFFNDIWQASKSKDGQTRSDVALMLIHSLRTLDLDVRLDRDGQACRQLLVELYRHFWPSETGHDQIGRAFVNWFFDLSRMDESTFQNQQILPLTERNLAELIVAVSPSAEATLSKLTDRMLRISSLRYRQPKLANARETEVFSKWLSLLRTLIGVWEGVSGSRRCWDEAWDSVYSIIAKRVDLLDITDHFVGMSDQHCCMAILNHWGDRHLDPEVRAVSSATVKQAFHEKIGSIPVEERLPFLDYITLIETYDKAAEGRYRRVLKDVLDLVLKKHGIKYMFDIDFELRRRDMAVFPSVVARSLTHADMASTREPKPKPDRVEAEAELTVWQQYIALHVSHGTPPAHIFKLFQYAVPQDRKPGGELSQKRAELLHFMAWCFATDENRPPLACFRQVYVCYQTLCARQAKVYPLLSRALVWAGIVRPLKLSRIRIDAATLADKSRFAIAARRISPILDSMPGRNEMLEQLRRHRLDQIECRNGSLARAGVMYDLNKALPKWIVASGRLGFILDVVTAVEGPKEAARIRTVVHAWRSTIRPFVAARLAQFGLGRNGGADGDGLMDNITDRKLVTVAVPMLREGRLSKTPEGVQKYRLWQTPVIVPHQADESE